MNSRPVNEQPGASDMRTRYVPGVRIRHGFLGMAPWLDIVLIIFYVVLLQSRIVLQPGIVVDLPAATPGPGLYSSLVAVVLVSGSPRAPVSKVFFDNEQYAFDDEARMALLKAAMTGKQQLHGETALTIYADRHVESDHLMMLMQLAQDAGFQRVNLGTKPVDMRP